MNKAAFLDIINHVATISEQEVAELEKLAVNFPYCQTAHLLLAKAAYDHGSMLSNQKLRRAAACAANRQLLKKLIYTAAAEVEIIPIAEPEIAAPEITPVITEILEANIEIAPTPEAVAPDSQEAEANAAAEILATPEVAEHPIVSNEITLPEAENESSGELNVEPETEAERQAESEEVPTEVIAEVEIIAANPTANELEAEINTKTELTEMVSSEEETENDFSDYQDGLFLIENLNPAAPYRDPVTDFINNLVFTEPESFTTEQIDLTDDVILAPNKPVAEQQENTEPEAEDINQENSASAPVAINNPDSPDTTLTQFDEYLFKPEKEVETVAEAETVTTTPYKEEIVYKIFTQNELGYWMDSSRLGETLQLKDELTPAQPYFFQPDLILEYSKQHELESYLPPPEGPLNRQVEIIDQFLRLNPKLKSMAQVKIKAEPMEDLSSKSTKIKKNVASETLANILIKQGKIKKAIKIYEHLILKIPEKKAYFVSQIEKLQKLT